MTDFVKYPRTPHLAGSRLQPDDDSEGQVPVESLTEGTLVFEEKVDGANAAFSFDANDRLLLQSRGHPLLGGPREAQFALFKAWTQTHEQAFREVFGRRYVVYGEWCFAKHYCHLRETTYAGLRMRTPRPVRKGASKGP
jgi:hypothetical protein